MFGSIKPGANAYAKVDIDTGALAASPHKLTTMLFDAALLALVMAQHHMKANEIEKKGKAISRAIMMIESGLRASLDKKAGGAIADNLDALYGYMTECLLTANLKNQPELLVEVQALLTDLRSTWQAIDPAAQAMAAPEAAPEATPAAARGAAPMSTAPKISAYGALSPRASSFVYG
jgi:flagellar protein FliS